MNLHETYLGIRFTIRDNGDGTCAWALHPPERAVRPVDGAGNVPGGQNEAILAARKAIGMYVDVLAAKPIKTRAKTGR